MEVGFQLDMECGSMCARSCVTTPLFLARTYGAQQDDIVETVRLLSDIISAKISYLTVHSLNAKGSN